MEIKAILLLFVGFLVAILVAYFSYIRSNNKLKSKEFFLFFLRFLNVFLFFLLLVNPTLKSREMELEKPKLQFLFDNSASIKKSDKKDRLIEIKSKIENNSDLNKKFDINYFAFGSDFSTFEKLDFEDQKTDIYTALKRTEDLSKGDNSSLVLISDGLQNTGFPYQNYRYNTPIYSVVLGDTTQVSDLRIGQINHNKYAYADTDFPVEIFLNYIGNLLIKSELEIYKNDKKIYAKLISLGGENTEERIEIKLNESETGNHFYRVKLKGFLGEKNLVNNESQFKIKVLNEKSKVLILYDYLHPDLGFWKRMIETNQEREVELVSVSDFQGDFGKYTFVFLFQPTTKFGNIFASLEAKNMNYFVQAGSSTNWNYLNQNQKLVQKMVGNGVQDRFIKSNPLFNTVNMEVIEVDNFPPLKDDLGNYKFNHAHDNFWVDVNEEQPILTFFNGNSSRQIFLFGENIYQWQIFNQLENGSKNNFPVFFSAVFQFLQIKNEQDRIELEYAEFLYANQQSKISLKAYDANFNFDSNRNFVLKLTHRNTKVSKEFPMILSGFNYETNIFPDQLGIYDFQVLSETGKTEANGTFIVSNFSLEEQTEQSDYQNLHILSDNSKGGIFLENEFNELIQNLLDNNSLKTIQKEIIHKKSLIDVKWILFLIVLSLALEWFIRKYHGLT